MTRRFHTAKHGLERRGKPIVLPIIALLIALGGWFADRQPSTADPETAASNKAVGQGEIAVSAKPIQGVTGEGAAFYLERNEDGRPIDKHGLIEEFTLLLPAGAGDRR